MVISSIFRQSRCKNFRFSRRFMTRDENYINTVGRLKCCSRSQFFSSWCVLVMLGLGGGMRSTACWSRCNVRRLFLTPLGETRRWGGRAVLQSTWILWVWPLTCWLHSHPVTEPLERTVSLPRARWRGGAGGCRRWRSCRSANTWTACSPCAPSCAPSGIPTGRSVSRSARSCSASLRCARSGGASGCWSQRSVCRRVRRQRASRPCGPSCGSSGSSGRPEFYHKSYRRTSSPRRPPGWDPLPCSHHPDASTCPVWWKRSVSPAPPSSPEAAAGGLQISAPSAGGSGSLQAAAALLQAESLLWRWKWSYCRSRTQPGHSRQRSTHTSSRDPHSKDSG